MYKILITNCNDNYQLCKSEFIFEIHKRIIAYILTPADTSAMSETKLFVFHKAICVIRSMIRYYVFIISGGYTDNCTFIDASSTLGIFLPSL